MDKQTHPPPHDQPAPDRDLPEHLTQWTGFLLAWVAERATTAYTQALKPLGLKPTHLGILTLLDAQGPIIQARLAEQLHWVKPALVGPLNELEVMGLVQRRAHPLDGRAFEVHLLEAGRQRLTAAVAINQTTSAAFFNSLTLEEQTTFHHLLQRLATTPPQHSKLQEPS